ncbi:MAG: hypothetical protein K5790_04625 [Nitrosopumilus sp.]|uniref:hypothetical protein n=1 Tax=Nitrosopumilus sp. TaxID=2024843 RepID=UPI00247B8277|nr:hypothetical protein [Nitrosopumilus sp.]MCV0392564.1 hypothetical protein [Nitrosopumilus sp.]
MENFEKTALYHSKSIQNNIMVLQLAISSFELQYDKFMDKNTKNEFESIKNAVTTLIDKLR